MERMWRLMPFSVRLQVRQKAKMHSVWKTTTPKYLTAKPATPDM